MKKTDLAGKRVFMDADSISHFCKGGLVGSLKFLLKGQLYILDDVEEELTAQRTDPHRIEVLQAIQGGVFTRMELPQQPEVLDEHAALCRLHCAGQAACLAVGRFVRNTVVVTNLPVLKNYGKKWGVGILDTVGLLKIAYLERLLDEADLTAFVQRVRRSGGHLSDKSLEQLPAGIGS